MAAPLNPHRVRLARRLRTIRAATGLSGNGFAHRIGWVQSRVSKLETGTQIPTEDDLSAWSEATGVGPDELAELRELLTAARIEYATWRDVARHPAGGLAGHQAAYAASEARATYIAEYQPAMIPGIAQTAAYARELLQLPGGPTSAGSTTADLEALVGQRIKRQGVLYESGRTIELIVGEVALHAAPGSAATMAGQLDRLVAVADLTAVELGIIPLGEPMPIMPVSGFSIEDDVIYIETLTGEQRLRDHDDTAVYRQAFEHLKHAAVRGNAASRLIHRISGDRRRRT